MHHNIAMGIITKSVIGCISIAPIANMSRQSAFPFVFAQKGLFIVFQGSFTTYNIIIYLTFCQVSFFLLKTNHAKLKVALKIRPILCG